MISPRNIWDVPLDFRGPMGLNMLISMMRIIKPQNMTTIPSPVGNTIAMSIVVSMTIGFHDWQVPSENDRDLFGKWHVVAKRDFPGTYEAYSCHGNRAKPTPKRNETKY